MGIAPLSRLFATTVQPDRAGFGPHSARSDLAAHRKAPPIHAAPGLARVDRGGASFGYAKAVVGTQSFSSRPRRSW